MKRPSAALFGAALLSLRVVRADEAAVAVSATGDSKLACSAAASKSKQISAAYITSCHDVLSVAHKSTAGDTLAYVTPWNGGGYDVAKRYTSKFAYISPTWLQIRDEDGGGVTLTGTHDIDQGWLHVLRTGCDGSGSCPRIVPRVVWESRRADARVTAAAQRRIMDAVQQYDFDGVVIEAAGAAPALDAFVKSLAAAVHARTQSRGVHNVTGALILVIPPSVATSATSTQGITPTRYAELGAHVDAFSVMTYDFSVHGGAAYGPNAPLPWTRSVIQALLGAHDQAQLTDEQRGLARKTLLGIPFYGYDNTDAVTAPRLLELLSSPSGADVRFNRDAAEHYVNYEAADGKRHTVYFPTPYAVAARAQLAAKLGTGASAPQLPSSQQPTAAACTYWIQC